MRCVWHVTRKQARSPGTPALTFGPPVRLVLLAAALAAGCGSIREEPLGEARCADFVRDVAPVLEASCAGCHGTARAEGDYRVESYAQLMSRRPDGSPRLAAGDESSAFVQAVRGALAGHEALGEEEQALLVDWAVRCRGATGTLRLHPQGFGTPTDPERFHGRVLRATGYALGECKDCHGEDLRGGTAQVDCNGCHPSGVSACNVCHGGKTSDAPPRDLSGATASSARGVGAHAQHLKDGPLHAAYACQTCHAVPVTAEDEGHYWREGAPDVDGAEVMLPTIAGRAPSYDAETQRCTTFCHAPAESDARATRRNPSWTGGAEEAGCGKACHGNPPASHADNRCEACHATAYRQGAPLPARHANGTVDVADGTGTCTGCHGGATSLAPPDDLLGRSDPSRPSVGVHQAHLQAPSRLSNPVACEECHRVPATLHAAGHIDSGAPAEVFPTGAGTVARADGAAPAYDVTAATCSNVYCHGGGTRAADDASTSLLRTPKWTGTASARLCGACHGVPPVDATHAAAGGLLQCHQCHGAVIDSSGAFKWTTDPGTGTLRTKHLDGILQLGPN